jgi:RimJ/RimL family protein N-acetyltransferase
MAAIEASFAELRHWMPWAQRMPTREEEEAVLAEGERSFEAGNDFAYSLWEIATDELVGTAGLMRRVGPNAIEIGYWVRSDRTGRGYATATARALTEAAFEYLPDVVRVEIHPDRANLASTAVPQKLGYTLRREDEREPFSESQSGISQIWTMERPAV